MPGLISTSLGPDGLAALIQAVPQLRGLALDDVAVPLGGTSNLNLRLDTPEGPLVLRLPRPNSAPFPIDRADEARAARSAGAAGIGPDILHADGRGTIVARFIEGAHAFDARRPGAVIRAGQAVRRLHRSGLRLTRHPDPFAAIEAYRAALADRHDSAWPDGVLAVLAAIRRRLAATRLPPVPSHGDLVPENLLDTGGRCWLVDWEYARMGDPAWDLAYLGIEADLDPDQDDALLAAYGDPALDGGRLRAMKLVAAALNAAWGLIQPAGTAFPDLDAWRVERLALAARLAVDPELRAWLAAIT